MRPEEMIEYFKKQILEQIYSIGLKSAIEENLSTKQQRLNRMYELAKELHALSLNNADILVLDNDLETSKNIC